MKPIILVCLLVAVAACGCTYGTSSGAITLAAEPSQTLQALPTLDVSPVPRSAADPIIGTWRWRGENNTLVIFSFMANGTFMRQDEGTGMGVTTGTWTSEGGGSYRLTYDRPGFVPEHVKYYPEAGRLGNRSDYFSRR